MCTNDTRIENTVYSSALPETVTISPLPTPVRPRDDLTVPPPPGPEYEEIQDVRQARRSTERGHTDAPGAEDSNASSGEGGEHALRGDYEFTKCPAYAVTTSTV